MTHAYQSMVESKRSNNSNMYGMLLNFDVINVNIAGQICDTGLPQFTNSKDETSGLFIEVSCLPVPLKATEYRLYLELGNAQKLLKRSKLIFLAYKIYNVK